MRYLNALRESRAGETMVDAVDVNKPGRYRVGHIVARRRPRIGYIRQRGRHW